MLRLVLAYTEEGREVTPIVLYIGHDADAANAAIANADPAIPRIDLTEIDHTRRVRRAPLVDVPASVETPVEIQETIVPPKGRTRNSNNTKTSKDASQAAEDVSSDDQAPSPIGSTAGEGQSGEDDDGPTL